MKKILALMLALAVALGCASALAAGTTVYSSDFSEGADGWVARSMGSAFITAENGALRIEGRQSNWHSPGRNFELREGVRYILKVQVLQSEVQQADFMISVAHTLNGQETYENLAFATVNKGAWTTLQCEYTPGHYDQYILYVETKNAPTLSYSIRKFVVSAPDGIPRDGEEAVELPALKDVYAGQFDFGIAAPQYLIRGGGAAMELVKQQFNILTPENELKPDSVLDVAASKKLVADTGDETAAAVHFDAAKPLLDFAKENGVKVHGHVLVWHSQTPEAFFHEGYDTNKPYVTREVMLGRLENYIKGVMEYMDANYPGVVVSWDVVNEAIDDGGNYLRPSNWTKVVGDDFLARAFELARKYAPEGTLLYYNDYNTAVSGKLVKIVQLLESLIPEGNIDGYGFQMHHSITYPGIRAIETCVAKIASLGLRLRISELDVGIDKNDDASLEAQALLYAQVMQLARKYSDQFEAVQVWGLTDSMSWRSGNYPLLFDGVRSPKPAFWAVADPDSYSEE